MADDLCAPFPMCDALDAQLLINRTADGPAIGIELGELPFGPVTMQGATLHPYVRWTYGQTWSAKEACLGPARSVMGLAPGETVSITVTHRESVDTTRLVREAADRSNALTRTERRPLPMPPTQGGAAGSSDKTREEELEEAVREAQERARQAIQSASAVDDGQVELQPIHYGQVGSPFFELIAGAIVGAITGEAQKAASGDEALAETAKQVEHEAAGGPGTINYDTSQRIAEIVEEVQRSERHSSLNETTTTTRSSSEQRVVRSFTNPYRDRSLELRFFPVFRRFEITTSILGAQPGVLLRPGRIDFKIKNPRAALATFVTSALSAQTLAATALIDPGDEKANTAAIRSSAVAAHLGANAALYTRRFVGHIDQSGSQDALLTPLARMTGAQRPHKPKGEPAGKASLADGLAWSRAMVRNGEIHVPLAAEANWPASWKDGAGKALSTGIAKTVGDATWRKQLTTTRSVYLFMGTHVEAVAGTCVLKDVPPPA